MNDIKSTHANIPVYAYVRCRCKLQNPLECKSNSRTNWIRYSSLSFIYDVKIFPNLLFCIFLSKKLDANVAGWISIGISAMVNPSSFMNQSDIIMGYFSASK